MNTLSMKEEHVSRSNKSFVIFSLLSQNTSRRERILAVRIFSVETQHTVPAADSVVSSLDELVERIKKQCTGIKILAVCQRKLQCTGMNT